MIDPGDAVSDHESCVGRLHIEDHRLKLERVERADEPFVELFLGLTDFRLKLFVELVVGLFSDQSLRDPLGDRFLLIELLLSNVSKHVPDDRQLIPVGGELAQRFLRLHMGWLAVDRKRRWVDADFASRLYFGVARVVEGRAAAAAAGVRLDVAIEVQRDVPSVRVG